MSIAASGKRTEGERQAMEVAEEARETNWAHPSFCAELYSGNFDFNLIYPFPEQESEDKRIGDEYVKRVLDFLAANHDPEAVDKTKEIPPP